MNNDEILNMPAGREMDVLIAEAIFCDVKNSWDWEFTLPSYSTDISAAWKVIEKLRSDDLSLGWRNRDFSITQMDRLEGGLWVVQTEKPSENNSEEIYVKAETAALAICRAALLAVVPVNIGGV